MNILHIIGKELAVDLRKELPKHLVTAYPAGKNQITLVVKLQKDKKNWHKFQIRKHIGPCDYIPSWAPAEYSVIHQYHYSTKPMYFDIEQPGSLEKLDKWIRVRCGVE